MDYKDIVSRAIRFAASLDHVMVVLSGMSNIGQMEDNISYMENFRLIVDTAVGFLQGNGRYEHEK